MKKLAAIAAIATGFTILGTGVASAATSGNLVVQNATKGTRSLTVCKSWETNEGWTAPRCPSTVGVLQVGAWSDRDPLYWRDTAAIKVPRGWNLKESISGPDRLIVACRPTTFWRRVEPLTWAGGVDRHRSFYLTWCGKY